MYSNKLYNFLKILDLMARPQGATIKEIAGNLHASERTAHRYIEMLDKMEFPIYDHKIEFDRKKRWKLEPSYVKRLPNISVPDLNLNFSEILALYLLKLQNKLYLDTEIEQHLNRAFQKINRLLPSKTLELIEKLGSIFIVNEGFAKDYSGKEEIINQLIEAVLKKHQCKISYYAFSSQTEKNYEIEPLYLFENKGGLYIFVRVPSREAICTLAIERIQDIRILSNKFEYPEDFDPKEYLDKAFDIIFDEPFKVKLWFDASQTRYIKERKFFQKKKIIDQEDGSIIVEFETTGWWDVKSWVMSLGSSVLVLEPERLKEEIIAQAEYLLQKYNIK